MNNKKNMEILANIWDKTDDRSLTCPQCGGSLTIVQMEPTLDVDDAYTPYKTIIECSSCSFKLETESVEIGSWTSSGSRDLSKYKHLLNYNLLKELKQSGELVEFLIVDKQVIQVIG